MIPGPVHNSRCPTGETVSGKPNRRSTVVWTVGGTVTHFGHRHFRQNRYNMQVTLVPIDETWKISAIEVLEEERVT